MTFSSLRRDVILTKDVMKRTGLNDMYEKGCCEADCAR